MLLKHMDMDMDMAWTWTWTWTWTWRHLKWPHAEGYSQEELYQSDTAPDTREGIS